VDDSSLLKIKKRECKRVVGMSREEEEEEEEEGKKK
jgi:hypothetical protein